MNIYVKDKVIHMYMDDYKRWLAADLEDPALKCAAWRHLNLIKDKVIHMYMDDYKRWLEASLEDPALTAELQ